jgi:poly(U)-specific endoribonuclease
MQSEAWNGYRKPLSEQQYSEDVDHQGVNVEPTREELYSLSKACSRLWELDMNRLVPGKDYRIDCGEGKKVYQKGDMASESLFSWLGDKEVVTQQDKHEEVAFIEENLCI